MTYIHCKTDGTKTEIETSTLLSLAELQKLVGGYIEIVRYDPYYLCVNEDGRLKNLPENPNVPNIVGDVVIGKLNKAGEFVGYNYKEVKNND